MGVFAALDVSQDQTAVCVVDADGTIVCEAKVDTCPDAILAWLERWSGELENVGKDDTTSPARVDNLEEKISAIKERRTRLEEHRAELEASGEDQISLTDPDARAMHSSSRIGVGYNIQIAVDTKHKLIAEQQVHNNVSDLGLLSETANAARENLGVEQIDVVADRGYYKIEDIEDCEAAGVTPYVEVVAGIRTSS